MVELKQRLTNREGEGEGEIERRMEDGGWRNAKRGVRENHKKEGVRAPRGHRGATVCPALLIVTPHFPNPFSYFWISTS